MLNKKIHIVKESAVSTLVVLIVTFLISFIPMSLEYTKVLHQGFSDFDIYDTYYAYGKHRPYLERDTNIVLVEIASSRSAIADQVNLLQKYQPKVIGLDVFFEGPDPDRTVDSLGDLRLAAAINSHPNVVLAFKTLKEGNINNYFQDESNKERSGYANFIGKKYAVIRSYSPKTESGGKSYRAFSGAIAALYDPARYRELEKRNQDQQLINYSAIINDSIENYLCISKEGLQELDSLNELGIISNKIILLGFFSRQSPMVLDDMHFTPTNEIVIGKSYPDMYGVVIHANILSMIIKGDYACLASPLAAYLFAFIFCCLFNLFVFSQYYKKRHPGHGILMLIQLLYIILVLYLFLLLFSSTMYKVPLEPLLISLVLSLEMQGLYKALALKLNKKYAYKTIFTNKKHV